MTIFEEMKNSVTARQAALQYGIKVGKNKMACCPFHNDFVALLVEKRGM